MTLGTKLRQLREQKRFSQQEVADLLNVAQSTYCQWESDQKIFRVNHLVQLARLFEVSYNDLLQPENTSVSTPLYHSTSSDYTAVSQTVSPDTLRSLLESKNEIIRLLMQENQRLLYYNEQTC